jgi:hypothetical protein
MMGISRFLFAAAKFIMRDTGELEQLHNCIHAPVEGLDETGFRDAAVALATSSQNYTCKNIAQASYSLMKQILRVQPISFWYCYPEAPEAI